MNCSTLNILNHMACGNDKRLPKKSSQNAATNAERMTVLTWDEKRKHRLLRQPLQRRVLLGGSGQGVRLCESHGL
jgi:hypothetical protein